MNSVTFSSATASKYLNALPNRHQDSDSSAFPSFAFETPEDQYDKVKKEELSQRRYPDWFVLTTLSQSFHKLATNGLISLDTVKRLRDQLHQNQQYREARVAHQLIQYKDVLINSGTPWQKGRFNPGQDGYSWPDIQYLLEKIKAGQDVEEIVTRDYEKRSRQAMYRANWADVVNVPLTLMVGLGGFLLGNIEKVRKLPMPRV